MESNKNIKVNINRPKLTPEELSSRKDFRNVLYNYKKMTKPFFKSPKFFSGLLVMATVIVLVILQVKEEKTEKSSPVINPPIPGFALKAIYYELDGESGGTISHGTGSVLKIPSNAFVDINGNPVTGKVKVSYREFHDPIDIIFSGIPMTYDSAGVQYNFETAGMMEILAFDPKGEALFLADGKQIDVSMASADERTAFNLYQLDTNGGNWWHLGKDQVEVLQASLTEAISETEEAELKTEFYNKDRKASKGAITGLDEIPVKPGKVNPSRLKFNISVLPEEFPELAAYKEIFFEIGEENKNFDPALANVTWEDAILLKGEPGKNFRLKLIKGNKKVEFIVYPVFEGRDYDKAMDEYNKQFDLYEASLTNRLDDEKRRKEEFALVQKQREEERKKQALEQQRIALEYAQSLAIKQRQDRIDESKRLAEAQLNNNKINTERAKVMRSFSISSLGVYNCDSPLLYPSGAQILASFKGQDGEVLNLNTVWLIEKEKAAVFTFNSYQSENLKFNPASKNYLIAVSNVGKTYFFLPEDFSKTPKQGEFCFNMKTPKVDLKNPEDVKAYLNL